MADLRETIGLIADIVTTVAIAVGAILVALDMRLRRQQIEEGLSRKPPSLDASIRVNVYPLPARKGQSSRWLLETRVDVKNVGTLEWCIPIVYVAARSADGIHGQPIEALALTEASFETLPACGSLSDPVNVAALPNAIFQPSPGHTTPLVRWDVVDSKTIQETPTLVFLATVLAAQPGHLGFFPNGAFGKYRFDWIDYMRGLDVGTAGHHRRVCIKRATEDVDNLLRRGHRVLLQSESGDVDIENSRRFRELLNSLNASNALLTVHVGGLTTPPRG